MAVTIKKEQIRNNAVDAAKLDSSDNFSFSGQIRYTGSDTNEKALATREYVDTVAAGLDPKDSCKVATTGNITLSGTQTIDGVSVSAGDRVLVKEQTDKKDNGIYICAAGSWSRSSDMAAGSDAAGNSMFIEQGTVNGDKPFVCTSNKGAAVVGTNDLSFSQYNGASTFEAGAALTKTGDRLDVAVDDSSIEIDSDALRVKAGGISNDMLAGSIANNKLANSTISGVSLGGALNALSAAATGGITITSYNGSAAVSDLAINLDGSSLVTGSNGLKINTAGVGTLQIADAAVTAQKLSGSIPADKLQLDSAFAESGGKLVLSSTVAGNGLALSSQVLTVDLDGSSLALGSNGIKISDAGVDTAQLADDAVTAAKIANGAINDAAMLADGVVANSKLAGSIPADKLNTGDGLQDNGGVLEVKLDGSSLTNGSDGLAIATNGVSTAAIADDQVTGAKLSFAPKYISLSGQNGSKTAFDLTSAVDAQLVSGTIVYLNGVAIEKVASSPSTDQYTVSATGGTGGVGQITMGTAPLSTDTVTVLFFG